MNEEHGDTRSEESVSQTVYRELFNRILTGELPPGSTVSEKQLAELLGVSRTPVHNAVLQLVKDGLVTQEANHRPVIGRVSESDVDEIFDMRRLLEGEAARRAASRMDRATLSRLRAAADLLARQGQRQGALARWADFDDLFHEAIAAACGSQRLAADIRRYRMVHHALNRLRMTEDLIPQALQEHVAILSALEARDADKAAAAMDDHLSEWKTFYLQQFAQRQASATRARVHSARRAVARR
ncbi:GntR family transcriptional regulator [Hydrogenophaga sp.]|uniref:GntR family transcriptional regulator n=1 Tax=Hydrogenophaga sp. TaxID=1904254 RepID=UPI003F71224B